MPTSLLRDDASLSAMSAAYYDEKFRRAEMIRYAAQQATISLGDNEAIARAIHAHDRSPWLPTPGTLVMYWLEAGISQMSKVLKRAQGWHGPAIVLWVYNQTRVFLLHAGGIKCVNPEQCRRSSATELKESPPR